ncbi:MAG TPA: hypothetical protein VL025_16845 [Thermoanaerobaculia bacterium]|nr:hypothetical protein [Thermoanaerobaculia bacterium]
MTAPWNGSRWIVALLLLSSCASAPAPAPSQPGSPAAPAAPSAAAQPPKPSKVSLLCGETARMVRFSDLGVPEGERPTDVALDSRYIYVLFPSRLLRIPQGQERFQAEMTIGRGDDLWGAMDIDPVDGSVWISTDHFVLRRITPNWQNEKVKVQNVAGEGGFQDIRATRDGLYAMPACAEDAVWRLDRTGKILGSAFPAPKRADEPLDTSRLGCSSVRLERDADGNLVAWDHENGKVFRVDGNGTWTETDPGFFRDVSSHEPTAKGLDIGTASERWYAAGTVGNLFYWKGRPVFLGPVALMSDLKLSARSRRMGTGIDSVLILPDTAGSRDFIHHCGDAFLIDVATTPERYAAITEEALILGDMATAPDLP